MTWEGVENHRLSNAVREELSSYMAWRYERLAASTKDLITRLDSWRSIESVWREQFYVAKIEELTNCNTRS